MSEDSLGGVWHGPSLSGIPNLDDILWIDEDRCRIVFFMFEGVDPLRGFPMKLWYEPVSPTSIRVAPQLNGHWGVQEFRFEGDTIVWKFKWDWVCRRLTPDKYPHWLEAKVAVAYKKMDDQEARA